MILSFPFLGFAFYHKTARKAPLNVILITCDGLNTTPFFKHELVSKAAVLVGWTPHFWERPQLDSRLKYRLFLLRRPVLLFDQLYKLVLSALFSFSASTLVRCFPCLQTRVLSVGWSHFRDLIGNLCPWTTVLNCMCIETFRYLHLLNVCENTSPAMVGEQLVRV
jgi:hypothetical protein